MKLKILKLFLWHLLFYFLFYELRIGLESQRLINLSDWLAFKDCMLNLSSILIFYTYALGTYLVLYYYYPKSILKIILGVISVFFVVVGTRYLVEEVVFLKAFGFDNYVDSMSAKVYVLRNLFYVILHVGFGCVFFFIEYSLFKEQQAKALLIENKKTELAYLRSQMNPHFLFNTLNNIYSLVYQKSDKALPALEKLTAMLRYSLYEGEDNIPLEKEIRSIENFILLEEMRYNYPLNIDFKMDENIANIKIPPFLLLPFVENAFKHGDMKSPLKIHLNLSNNQLQFNVQNRIKTKQKDNVGGIGLENIKKRLALIYADNYELIINEKDKIFEISLLIQM